MFFREPLNDKVHSTCYFCPKARIGQWRLNPSGQPPSLDSHKSFQQKYFQNITNIWYDKVWDVEQRKTWGTGTMSLNVNMQHFLKCSNHQFMKLNYNVPKYIHLYESQFIINSSAIWTSALTPATEQPQIYFNMSGVWHSSSMATFRKCMRCRKERALLTCYKNK